MKHMKQVSVIFCKESNKVPNGVPYLRNKKKILIYTFQIKLI